MADPLILREATIRAAWNVQGDPRRLRLDVPVAPNTVGRLGAASVFWLGPRSWLVLGDRVEVADGAVFDVSAARVAYELAGEDAPILLSAHCPLDFHLSAFARGTCAQSLFGQVNTLYYRHTTRDAWTLFVARSFARGVRHHLTMGVVEEAPAQPFVAD
ncbi:MAG: hypothetical protein IT518_27940 [Burkholderiales bacterium]|nr:hypothetical protein [Burkholderiales bacterium]